MNDWFRPSTLSRWAAVDPPLLTVLLVVPIALVTSPSRTEHDE